MFYIRRHLLDGFSVESCTTFRIRCDFSIHATFAIFSNVNQAAVVCITFPLWMACQRCMEKAKDFRGSFDCEIMFFDKVIGNLWLRWRDVQLVNNSTQFPLDPLAVFRHSRFKCIKTLWIGKMLFHQSLIIRFLFLFPPASPTFARSWRTFSMRHENEEFSIQFYDSGLFAAFSGVCVEVYFVGGWVKEIKCSSSW